MFLSSRFQAGVGPVFPYGAASLRNAPPARQGDKAFVLRQVGVEGAALQYASPALRGDPEVVAAAVAQVVVFSCLIAFC